MPSWFQKRRIWIAAVLIVLLVFLAGGWSYTQMRRKARPRPVELAETLGAKFPFYYRWLDGRFGLARARIPKALHNKVEQAYLDHCARRIKAAEELARMGTNAWPVVPILVGYLDKKDMESSFAAATVLARIDALSHREWPMIERQLRERSGAVVILRHMIFGKDGYMRAYDAAHRRFAMTALGAIGPAAATACPELIEFFKYDEDQALRGVALRAAARIDPAKTVPLLQDSLKNGAEWPQVSAVAALALAEVAPEDPGTRPLLHNALNDHRSLARLGAARALWKLKEPASQVLPVMTALLNHRLPSIRKAALDALAEMGNAASPSRLEIERLTLDQNETVRRAAVSALTRVDYQTP
jgi:hypothetical protein